MRTWVYRVAHNVGISRNVRRRRPALTSLEELAEMTAQDSPEDPEDKAHAAHALATLQSLIRKLKPPDDQVMLLYLEDMDAAAIGDVTGLSARAVATRIHRIKLLLSRHFRQGEAP
jgi:RNA polymerase sigma-70 factor (ECF subfamily)